MLVSTTALQAQDTKLVRLKKADRRTPPTHYYIERVTDMRADTNTIGMMRAGLANRPAPINLQGGAATSFTQYIAAAIGRNAALTPLTLQIEDLKISEKGGAMRERASIEYTYGFSSKGTKLVSYSGSAYIETSADASAYIEKLVRQSIDNILDQAEHQWDQISGLMKPATVAVQVIFESDDDKNVITYSRQRPLMFTDFQGTADDLSRASAATYSGLSINLSSQTANNKMVVKIGLNVFADAGKSWMRVGAREISVLNHEQLHFDITALQACQLKEQLQSQTFTPDNVRAEVMKLYKEANHLTREEQELYDKETMHGQIKAEQAKWKSNLEHRMAEQDCFK